MLNLSFNNKQFENFKQQRYNEILHHEQQHKAIGGSLAGPIVIEKDSNGIAYAGHVAIKMPKLNKDNPDETIKDAKTVIASALAPSDPSGQDFQVASNARNILNQAQNYKKSSQGNKLDIIA